MFRVPIACLLSFFASSAFAGTICYTLGGALFGMGSSVVCFPSSPIVGTCPVTSGPLTINAFATRTTGVSPLLVFYDATATTDATVTTSVFQNVYATWNFGDSGTSGTSTWKYGSNPNVNSRNTASGLIAAHEYIAAGADTTYTATITATDPSGNTASCTVPSVTAYNPSGVNGFPTTNTTCVSASGTPIAGSGGCPTSATVLNTASYTTALGPTHIGSGKRVLFKCGDTFTGSDVTISGAKWSVGAYGSPDCSETQTNRPIIDSSATTSSAIAINVTAGDGRVSDLDFQGATTGNGAVAATNSVLNIPYQITLNNLNSNGNKSSYFYAQGAQWGMINVVQASAINIATYINTAANNPCATSTTNQCWGFGTSNPFNNLDYQALIGSHINGVGTGGASGVETVRVGACRMCVLENTDFLNANNVGATLKFHNGNTFNSLSTSPACVPPANASCWTGVYTELTEISDNFFGGNSGAQLVEITPENGNDDERLRSIVFERNLVSSTTGAQFGRMVLVGGVNITLRDNAFFTSASAANPAVYAIQVCARGVEPAPQNVEVYNNILYSLKASGGQALLGFDNASVCTGVAGGNSFAKNNLYFLNTAGHPTIINNGTGNTVSNNTATSTNDPLITNGSTTFSIMTDFKPTANFTGGTTVPVITDALGTPWSPTWDFGPIHH